MDLANFGMDHYIWYNGNFQEYWLQGLTQMWASMYCIYALWIPRSARWQLFVLLLPRTESHETYYVPVLVPELTPSVLPDGELPPGLPGVSQMGSIMYLVQCWLPGVSQMGTIMYLVQCWLPGVSQMGTIMYLVQCWLPGVSQMGTIMYLAQCWLPGVSQVGTIMYLVQCWLPGVSQMGAVGEESVILPPRDPSFWYSCQ
jgi:hypothetical protein